MNQHQKAKLEPHRMEKRLKMQPQSPKMSKEVKPKQPKTNKKNKFQANLKRQKQTKIRLIVGFFCT